MYFKTEGKINSQATVELALKTASEKNIEYLVVASVSGDTAKLLAQAKKQKIICVTHVNGFSVPGENEMSLEVRRELENSGMQVLTTTHVLSGAERGLRRAFGGIYPVETMANALRMFGQGTKVCVEVAIMALDAGLIPYGKPVIALGGTETGVDTAVIITPAHASNLLDTKIHEIICKPELYG